MRKNSFKNIKSTFGKALSESKIEKKEVIFFYPALIFLFSGLAFIVAPKLVIFLVSSVFLALGVLMAVVAWKFMQIKRKFDHLSKQFHGAVFIQNPEKQGFDQSNNHFDTEIKNTEIIIESGENGKKIIYH